MIKMEKPKSRVLNLTKPAGSVTGLKTSTKSHSQRKPLSVCGRGSANGEVTQRGQGSLRRAHHRRLDSHGGRRNVDAPDVSQLSRLSSGSAAYLPPHGADDTHSRGVEQTPVGFRKAVASFDDGAEEIEIVEISPHRLLKNRIAGAAISAAIAAILEKDRPLVEAALATDQRIASLDNRARNLFKGRVLSLTELASICWVNPEKIDETAVSWLQQGAPADRARMLGYVLPPSGE